MQPVKSPEGNAGRRIEIGVLAIAGVFYAAGAFTPWGWPSVDGYPAIERFIDPAFLANDFYTNTTTAYNVDTLLAATLGAAQKATGVKYDVILAALNLVRCMRINRVTRDDAITLGGRLRVETSGTITTTENRSREILVREIEHRPILIE